MSVESFLSEKIPDASFRGEVALYRSERPYLAEHSIPVVFGAMLAAEGSSGLRELTQMGKNDSVTQEGMVVHIHAIERNIGAVVSGNLLVATEDMLVNGKFDQNTFFHNLHTGFRGYSYDRFGLDTYDNDDDTAIRLSDVRQARALAKDDPTLTDLVQTRWLFPRDVNRFMDVVPVEMQRGNTVHSTRRNVAMCVNNFLLSYKEYASKLIAAPTVEDTFLETQVRALLGDDRASDTMRADERESSV